MDRIKFLTHGGKQILLVDCSHCAAEEVAAIAKKLPSYVTEEPPNSVLLLADFTDAQFSRDAIEEIKKAAVFHRSHLKRSAWVGTESLPNAYYKSIKDFSLRELPTFKSRDEALEYLAA